MEAGIILFDGDCNLCRNVVRFITANDNNKRFCFVPLGSENASLILSKFNIGNADSGSVLLITDNRVYSRSGAALQIIRKLDGLWPLLYFFIIVPQFIRDPVYNLISRYRYKWFGRATGDLKYRSCCF
jgi:predicted DCC family thiol-disulfide oxidoreductase YuxK